MKAEQLKPMTINPGDPITAELMTSIVTNINLINSLSNGGSSDGTTGTTGAQIIESGRLKVACKMDGTGKVTVKFAKKFAAKPNVVCTVWQPSANNFLTHKYVPVITAGSDTEFTIQMMPTGATKNGEVYVQWIAVS